MGFLEPAEQEENYYSKKENMLSMMPKCKICMEHIQQEDAFCFNNEYICDQCIEDMRVDLLFEQ